MGVTEGHRAGRFCWNGSLYFAVLSHCVSAAVVIFVCRIPIRSGEIMRRPKIFTVGCVLSFSFSLGSDPRRQHQSAGRRSNSGSKSGSIPAPIPDPARKAARLRNARLICSKSSMQAVALELKPSFIQAKFDQRCGWPAAKPGWNSSGHVLPTECARY